MKTASPNFFVPIKPGQIKEYFASNVNERKDTNIGLISFSFLKEGAKAALNPADLLLCSHCTAALNFLSQIREEFNEEKTSQDYLWTCEFCGHENSVDISDNEKIKKSDPLYSIQREAVKEETKKAEETVKEEMSKHRNFTNYFPTSLAFY